MTTPELIDAKEQFTLHRRESEEEFGIKGTTHYTVDAPRWYVTFNLADETLELANGQDILSWHFERGTRQIIDAILDNPLVSAEVHRRYVVKEKVREILREPRYDAILGYTPTLQDLWRLLEKEDE